MQTWKLVYCSVLKVKTPTTLSVATYKNDDISLKVQFCLLGETYFNKYRPKKICKNGKISLNINILFDYLTLGGIV